METRNITITLEKAIELYNSDNESLKDLALQAFSKEDLMYNFRDITSFKKACDALNYNYDDIISKVNSIAEISRASAAMFKLNIIRKALNFGYNLHLVKNAGDSNLYYPVNLFITKSCTFYKSELESSKIEIIGKIKSERNEYYVIGNNAAIRRHDGVGRFSEFFGIGNAKADIGFLGCANEEIAKHFSKYFGMLITEAKYVDLVDFKIIEEKYKI